MYNTVVTLLPGAITNRLGKKINLKIQSRRRAVSSHTFNNIYWRATICQALWQMKQSPEGTVYMLPTIRQGGRKKRWGQSQEHRKGSHQSMNQGSGGEKGITWKDTGRVCMAFWETPMHYPNKPYLPTCMSQGMLKIIVGLPHLEKPQISILTTSLPKLLPRKHLWSSGPLEAKCGWKVIALV